MRDKNREKLFPWEPKIENLYQRLKPQTVPIATDDLMATVHGIKGVFRNDNNHFLGAVSPSYTNITNASLEQCIYNFEEADCEVISHGEWFKGKIVWVQLKSSQLTDAIIGDNQDDKMKSTILVASGHAGKLPFTVRGTTIRVVCWNTFLAAMQGNAAINIRHKGEAQERVYAFNEQITEISKATREVYRNFNRMAKVPVTSDQIDNFAHSMLSIERNQPELPTRSVNRLDGMLSQLDATAGNTAWGAFNMVTGYVDHFQYKKEAPAKGDYEFGYKPLLNNPLKQKAYKRMMDYTEKYEQYSKGAE
jgi:hypothetical protein